MLQFLISILIISGIFLVPTNYGLPVAAVGLAVGMFGCNRATIGVFLLFFGTSIFGYAANMYGYPGVGGKLTAVIGLLILNTVYPLYKVVLNCQKGLMMLSWSFGVLIFSYFMGPQTPECTSKLMGFLINSVYFFFAYYFIFRYRSVDWFRLGQLGVLSVILYVAIGFAYELEYPGSNVFAFGAVREAWEYGRIFAESIRPGFNYQTMGNYAAIALTFAFFSQPDTPLKKSQLFSQFFIVCVVLCLVAWSGTRQSFIMLFLTMLAVFVIAPKRKKRYLTFASVGTLMIVAVIVAGVLSDFGQFVSSTAENLTLAERLNRGKEFETAIMFIKQSPLFGQGLGGFYIPGESSPGVEIKYAHNIILELLSETGFVGTFLFLMPWLISLSHGTGVKLKSRSASGGAVFPIVVAVSVKVMISSNLAMSPILFSILAVMTTGKSSKTRFDPKPPSGNYFRKRMKD